MQLLKKEIRGGEKRTRDREIKKQKKEKYDYVVTENVHVQKRMAILFLGSAANIPLRVCPHEDINFSLCTQIHLRSTSTHL
jgi:hypothetical protein